MQYQDRRSISVLEWCQCCKYCFDSLHIFISELLDYLLPIKNGYIMGGAGGGGGAGHSHGVGSIGLVLIFATLK